MNIEEIGLTVLLLASQARLLELFRSLEAQGMLQLQVASSITDAERLLSENPPDFAFIQSRISALSGELVVRHVRSYLAKDAKIVLLSGDEEELRKAPSLQVLPLSLGSSDDSLRYAVRELLVTAEKPQHVEVPPPPPPSAEETGSEAASAAGADESPAPPLETRPEPPPPQGFESALDGTLRAQQPHEPQPERGEEERRARETVQKVQRRRRSAVMAPARSLRDFASKTYLSPRRLQRRTVLAIGALLLCAAAGGYFVLAVYTPGSAPKSYPIPARPASPVPTAPAPQAPAPREEAIAPEAPPAPSKTGKGLRDLPAFVVDAEQDTEYGKTHPGWERYLTSRMEYKIFREGTLIKAVQVMAARDETVPAEIYNWARKEFAGSGHNRLASKEQKGNYQVEKWQADGAGLTVYRKEPELKMRALVLYFR